MRNDIVPTEEEIKELGIGEFWCKVSPWDIPKAVQDLRERKAEAQQEEVRPSGMTAEEEAEALADYYADLEAEEEQEAAQNESGPDTSNETAAETVTNDGWEDMTHKNKWEWLDRIETGYNLSNNAFRVAHALAGFGGSNNTKGIFPNHKTLATKTEQSVGNVKKGLGELETKDLIRKVGGGRGHSVRYTIGVPAQTPEDQG